MSTTTLEAVKMPLSDMMLDDFKKFGEVALEKLGYTSLKSATNEASFVHELSHVLNSENISIFTPSSVNKYKKEASSKANRKRTIALWSVFLTFILLTILASVFIGIGGTILVGLPSILILLIFYLESNRIIKVWDSVEIDDYQRPIPVEVLKKAVAIKEKLPEAKFYVEELEERRKIDLFLFIKSPHSSKRYYIAVWDEPDFKI